MIKSASRAGLTPSPTCQPGQGGIPQGDVATSATNRVARTVSPPRIKPMEGFFMSKEPKPPTQPKGRLIYKGSVPDTDPRYNSGWNYLSGKNLNLPSVLGLRSFPLRLQPELDQAGHFARSFLKSRNTGGPFKNLCLRTSGSSIGAFGSMCRSITLAASSAVRAAAFALGRSAGFTVSPISTKRADCFGKRWRRSVRKRNRQRLSAHARRLKR
jgi:hypothetical protein